MKNKQLFFNENQRIMIESAIILSIKTIVVSGAIVQHPSEIWKLLIY